jgi:RHS repeat-associated protein
VLTLRRFKYDALGQLTQAQFATVNAPVQDQNSTYLPPSYTPSTNYKLWNLTYDKNGNLQTLDRNGRGEGLAMDQLAYTYALDGNGHKTNNRLLQVTDEVNTSAYHTSFQLPAGQGSNNYSYNAMGQLTGDALEGKYYTYYANGRVKAVHADAARTQTLASFTYDAAGNRLLKVAYATDGTTPTERTWYLRDGSGGVMSYAIEDVALQTTTEELPIAGVGSYLRASLRTRYEVSDHLGNTRVSFTTDGNGDVLVIEAHDYYPHGGLLPGRQLSGTGGSPLAYQGQEYDPEVGLTAFNLRQYDGRIGRWLTTDPYGQHHSPYLAMSNNPVSFVDPDGGYDQRDRLIDEIWDSGLGLSAAFSNWDEYYLYRDEQDQYDQGYMVEDYQAYYSYQYCQWRQVVTIGGRSESVLMQTKRSHERINVYISRRHMTTGERIYERVSRNLKQRPGYFDGMGTEMASGFMETLHTSLDLVGMAPGIGEGADVVNGLIYLAEGDRWNAGISFAGAAVVVGGQAITGARLMAKGTAGAAKTATRWGPTTGAGPLGERIAATFRGGSYTEMVTQEATTLYRAYGGNAEELGSYWTRTAPTGPLQTRIDGALLPKWGNTAESVSRITVPKGTTIYDGFAAPQGNLMGGGSQVFIPQVNPQWLVK